MTKPEARGRTSDLIRGIRDAHEDWASYAAILWTYLEENLPALGTLADKHPHIRAIAINSDPFAGVTEDDLKAVAKDPVRSAAILLARIDLFAQSEGKTSVAERPGITGEPVFVAWRGQGLATRLGCEDDLPPDAQQAPSVPAIARSIVVSPKSVGGIHLEYFEPAGEGWDTAQILLAAGMEEHTLAVHMDPLVDPETDDLVGTTGWHPSGDHGALLLDEKFSPGDLKSTKAVIRGAVTAASGSPSILIAPELVAAEQVEAAAASAISDEGYAPAMTVIGRTHRPGTPDPAMMEALGDSKISSHVNEAIVLGPDGRELWVQRKLSYAQSHDKDAPFADDESVVTTNFEAIVSGNRIRMVETPLGTVTVAICLDVFAASYLDLFSRSPANVILVPSLSPHVKRHETSLLQLVQRLWGVAFVSNRDLKSKPDGKPDHSGWREPEVRSFWAIQRQYKVQRCEAPTRPDHLSFVCRLPPKPSTQV